MSSADAPFPRTVEVALTEAEFDAYAAAMTDRIEALAPIPPLLPFVLTAGGVAVGGALLAIVLGATDRAGGVVVGLLLLGAFVAGCLVMMAAMSRYVGRLTLLERAGSRHLREMARYDIRADGIAITGATTNGFWAWAALGGVTIERDLLILRTGPTQGFAIPLRAFPDAAAAEAVRRHIAACITAARPVGRSAAGG